MKRSSISLLMPLVGGKLQSKHSLAQGFVGGLQNLLKKSERALIQGCGWFICRISWIWSACRTTRSRHGWLVVQIWNQTKKEMSTYGSTFQSHFNGLRFIVLGMGMISCIRSSYPAVRILPHRLIDPLQLHRDKAWFLSHWAVGCTLCYIRLCIYIHTFILLYIEDLDR